MPPERSKHASAWRFSTERREAAWDYPHRWPYAHRASDPISFGRRDEGITFQHLVLRQLRGREWERDYGQRSVIQG